jgi:hypothetical protein
VLLSERLDSRAQSRQSESVGFDGGMKHSLRMSIVSYVQTNTITRTVG